MNYTTIAAWPLAIAKALEAQGVDSTPIFEQAQLKKSDLLDQPSSRVDIQKMTSLWQLAQAKTSNPAFGLEVANYVQPMHLNTLGILFLACKDLEEVLEKINAYGHLVSNSVELSIQSHGQDIGFCIKPIPQVNISPLAVDGFFATFVSMSKQLQTAPLLIKKVQLQCATPLHAKPWFDTYGCPVHFNCENNILWMDKQSLKACKIMGDAFLAKHNEMLVKQQLNELTTQSWTAKTQALLSADLHKTLNLIAKELNTNERSLRRYLQNEHTSFREISQSMRMEKCQTYLIEQQLSITDTALKLGFSDSANFSRAFLTWFGMSPSQYKRQYKH